MTAHAEARFDVNALKRFAGPRSFARGKAYCQDGRVALLAVEDSQVLARVEGTEPYRIALRGRGTDIDGECSCRAFDDGGFCKHMVAVALAVNGQGDDEKKTDSASRIRAYLKTRETDALVDMIVDLAARDPLLFDRLEFAATAAAGDSDALEEKLTVMIGRATDTRGYVDYREASSWAEGMREPLDAIADLCGTGQAALALKMARHAIERLQETLELIDDSDGRCVALLHRSRDIHLQACRQANPAPVDLARELFETAMTDGYDVFEGAAAVYADVLGDAGVAEYRRLATEAWERLPSRAGTAEYSWDHSRLKEILDFFAEQDGDIDTRIQLRAKDLSSPGHYHHLAQFCLSHGRSEAALRWAEEGLWVFQDERPQEPLVLFAAELLEEAGRQEDARSLVTLTFEKSPSLRLYSRLRTFGPASREHALSHLEKLAQEKAPARWNVPADLLISALMEEQDFDAAWTAVRAYGCSQHMTSDLARQSEATHPEQAVAVYTEMVEQLTATGGSAYAQAAQLIARMAALRGESEQADYVADLKQRHRRKRNFMKLLG